MKSWTFKWWISIRAKPPRHNSQVKKTMILFLEFQSYLEAKQVLIQFHQCQISKKYKNYHKTATTILIWFRQKISEMEIKTVNFKLKTYMRRTNQAGSKNQVDLKTYTGLSLSKVWHKRRKKLEIGFKRRKKNKKDQKLWKLIQNQQKEEQVDRMEKRSSPLNLRSRNLLVNSSWNWPHTHSRLIQKES